MNTRTHTSYLFCTRPCWHSQLYEKILKHCDDRWLDKNIFRVAAARTNDSVLGVRGHWATAPLLLSRVAVGQEFGKALPILAASYASSISGSLQLPWRPSSGVVRSAINTSVVIGELGVAIGLGAQGTASMLHSSRACRCRSSRLSRAKCC